LVAAIFLIATVLCVAPENPAASAPVLVKDSKLVKSLDSRSFSKKTHKGVWLVEFILGAPTEYDLVKVVNQLATELDDVDVKVGKVNALVDAAVAEANQITSFPAFVLVVNGTVTKFNGTNSYEELKQFVNQTSASYFASKTETKRLKKEEKQKQEELKAAQKLEKKQQKEKSKQLKKEADANKLVDLSNEPRDLTKVEDSKDAKLKKTAASDKGHDSYTDDDDDDEDEEDEDEVANKDEDEDENEDEDDDDNDARATPKKTAADDDKNEPVVLKSLEANKQEALEANKREL